MPDTVSKLVAAALLELDQRIGGPGDRPSPAIKAAVAALEGPEGPNQPKPE